CAPYCTLHSKFPFHTAPLSKRIDGIKATCNRIAWILKKVTYSFFNITAETVVLTVLSSASSFNVLSSSFARLYKGALAPSSIATIDRQKNYRPNNDSFFAFDLPSFHFRCFLPQFLTCLMYLPTSRIYF